MPTAAVTAWAHLPNANHIGRILADVKARPEVWSAAGDAAWVAAGDAAGYAAGYAAWDALAALIAWDDSAALLDMPPDAVRMLYLTETEYKHAAVLLLPAVIALNTKD